jgi:hypothetical protein
MSSPGETIDGREVRTLPHLARLESRNSIGSDRRRRIAVETRATEAAPARSDTLVIRSLKIAACAKMLPASSSSSGKPVSHL